jgi:ammonium transporter, Amt family
MRQKYSCIYVFRLCLAAIFACFFQLAMAQTALPVTQSVTESTPLASPPATVTAAATAATTASPTTAKQWHRGDIAWVVTATLLIVLMAIPGLALFYGGLVREKNMISVLTQVFAIVCLVMVLWFAYGYTLAFSEGNAFFGKLNRFFMGGITEDALTGTNNKGVYIPTLLHAVFQSTFAAFTCALLVGAFAERVKFSALLVFTALWLSFCYVPIAHMAWYSPDLDGFLTTTPTGQFMARGGLFWQWGALDFAGGTVVHINAGVAGLMGAIVVGQRLGYGREPLAPHSLTMTYIGVALMWVGWIGFNAGSNLEANLRTGLVVANTMIAGATGALAWMFSEWVLRSKPSLLGIVSGAIAGLVAVTPASGYVGLGGAAAIGAIAGLICLWAVGGLKQLIGVDDSLDVFCLHGVGGVVGALLTAVFTAPSLGGEGLTNLRTGERLPSYDMVHQLTIQLKAVGVTIIWAAVVSFILFTLIDKLIGMRVSSDDERRGLDLSSHGEKAYNR